MDVCIMTYLKDASFDKLKHIIEKQIVFKDISGGSKQLVIVRITLI